MLYVAAAPPRLTPATDLEMGRKQRNRANLTISIGSTLLWILFGTIVFEALEDDWTWLDSCAARPSLSV